MSKSDDLIRKYVKGTYTIDGNKEHISPGDVIRGVFRIHNQHPTINVPVKEIRARFLEQAVFKQEGPKSLDLKTLQDYVIFDPVVEFPPGAQQDFPFTFQLPTWQTRTDRDKIKEWRFYISFHYIIMGKKVQGVRPYYILPVKNTDWEQARQKEDKEAARHRQDNDYIEEEVPESELKGLKVQDLMMRGWIFQMSGATGKWQGKVVRKVRIQGLMKPTGPARFSNQAPPPNVQIPSSSNADASVSQTDLSFIARSAQQRLSTLKQAESQASPAPLTESTGTSSAIPTKVCPNCGNDLPSNAKFCNKCGNKC